MRCHDKYNLVLSLKLMKDLFNRVPSTISPADGVRGVRAEQRFGSLAMSV